MKLLAQNKKNLKNKVRYQEAVVIVIGEKIEKLKLYVEYVKHIFAKNIVDKHALTTITEDKSENVSTCFEAKGLLKSIKTLKTSFMSIFWGDILERFNACSKKLQSIQIDLGIVVEIYQSLIGFVHDIRCDDMFNDYKTRAIEKCGISSLNTNNKREKKRKRFFDEGNGEEQVFDDEYENFKVNTYFMILDQIKSDLEKIKIAYDNLTSKYNFFYHLSELTPAEVKKNSESLQSLYKKISIYIRNYNLVEVYPYIDIALRMILCTPATNCSAERSFSTLKRVKSYLRSTMKEERLNALAVLNIESELTRELDYKDIIEDFPNKQSRKKLL
ncbi:uncharacterized protein LOC132932593 [Metopolophium dirhodum]|uniref:uncharacterized protein LOC132932593 n=1 Tax=Metopolophium dirhodum TaxID=44670 RepID=UPI0029907924|nr:uncharacterized protein LOC132932593 [Metopolophium dirhodum]